MRVKITPSDALWLALAGIVTGVGSSLLTKLGNPIDGGISIACFLRDSAGALGLHQVIEFSFFRPEIIAIAFGAFFSSLLRGKAEPTGGSSGFTRFIIGVILSFGVFAFVGCPMRVGLRLAGGDPAALAGLAGLIAGAGAGTAFLARGFSLGKSQPVMRSNAYLFYFVLVLLLVMIIVKPIFITTSSERHAPLWAGLLIGGAVGVLGQQSKLCFIGGFRNFFLIRDTTLLVGFGTMVLSAAAATFAFGQAHWGIHIIGSSDIIWSFIALLVVGMASVFLGGCPFRQLVLAGQGSGDSAIALLGIAAGAAIAYNYGLAFTAGSLDSVGKIAVLGGLGVLLVLGIVNTRKQ